MKTVNEVIFAIENKSKGCPVCDNRMGFAFGTCVECGFNHLSGKFKNIETSVDDLEKGYSVKYLVLRHASKYLSSVNQHDLEDIKYSSEWGKKEVERRTVNKLFQF